MCCQVKDLFKELRVECNVVELDLIGKVKSVAAAQNLLSHPASLSLPL